MNSREDSEKRHVTTDRGTGCPPRDLLSWYAHDALSEDDADLVNKHLEACSSCRDYVRQVRAVLSVAARAETEDPGASFNEELWRRIKAEKAKRKAKIALYPALAAAAVALVFILPFSRGDVRVSDPELVEQLGLFQNIELMENLELVESIDFIVNEEGWGEES